MSFEPGRYTVDAEWGQCRTFISSQETSVFFQPASDSFVLDWSVQGPALLALHQVLLREIANDQLESATFIYGHPGKVFEDRGPSESLDWFYHLVDAFERGSDNPDNQVEFARFDFATRTFSLSSIVPNFTLAGLAYGITRTNGKAHPADIQAMRRAFMTTAEESVKPELDWALETLIP